MSPGDLPTVRHELENLLYRYGELADDRDADELGHLLAEATLEFPGLDAVSGAGPIRDHYRRAFDGAPPSRHVITNVIIDVDSAHTASARCRYTRWILGASPEMVAMGEYRSTFRIGDAGWRFYRHVITRSLSA